MNQQIIQELTKWNPGFRLGYQIYYMSDYVDTMLSEMFLGYDDKIVDKINGPNEKYRIDEEYTEELSLLHMYTAKRVTVDATGVVNIIKYNIVLNVCDTSKYDEWSSEQRGIFGGKYEYGDIGDIKFHDVLIGDKRFMGRLDFIACHGSKCRLGMDGNVWCTDCFGELDCHNIRHFLKPKISFSSLPPESIVYAEMNTVKVDWSNKEHTDSLKNFSYYVRGLNEKIRSVNRSLDEKRQMVSDYRIIDEFSKCGTNLELIGALHRVIPKMNVVELETICVSLQTDASLLTNELANAVSCDGVMPKQLMDLLNISVQI